MNFSPIGTVRSSRREPTDDNWNQESVYIELGSDYTADSLMGLGDFSHVEVLFYMDKVDPLKIVTDARHPRENRAWPKVGIFAQRGKNRPNQIGLTICEIVRIEGSNLHLKGLDAIDGTPVLDLKPWMKEFGPLISTKQPAWSSELMESYWENSATEVATTPSPEEQAIQEIKALRKKQLPEQAFAEVQAAIARFPKSARLHYLAASICDADRTEAEAVPYYLSALDLGLSNLDRRDAFLGLGSTYRSLGDYEKSEAIFQRGLNEFPEYRPYHVFMALTDFNLNRADKALRALLVQLIETTNDTEIRSYERALRFYSTRLNETFE